LFAQPSFFLAHRVSAAFVAISLRRAFKGAFARACPPTNPPRVAMSRSCSALSHHRQLPVYVSLIRHRKLFRSASAVIVTTNLPFSEWPQVFTNARLCKAMLDRLTDQAHIIETGSSYRTRRAAVRWRRHERHGCISRA
jgi:hypothetical protein